MFCHAELAVIVTAAADMSDDEFKERTLGSAKAALSGKSDLDRTAVLHQHIGSRAMTDMAIETFSHSAGTFQNPKPIVLESLYPNNA